MASENQLPPRLPLPIRVSFALMAATFIVAGWLHLAGPLIGGLFAFLALTKLQFTKRIRRWLAVVLFVVLLCGLAYTLGYVINQTIRALPEIADKAIPTVIQWAKQHNVELPFTDYDSLKDAGFDIVKSETRYLGSVAKFASGATAELIAVLVGIFVAMGAFLQPRFELEGEKYAVPNNLFSHCAAEFQQRWRNLYASFSTVMGAQVIISAINTLLTAIFVLVMNLKYGIVVIGVTFLCGLIPVVGNLVSNTIIVAVGVTVSPKTALIALIYLVVIHKLEYFLNSKIVGDRIRNPFWLTLLALLLGERLMGIPGMILAPVVLHYIRMESSRIEVRA